MKPLRRLKYLWYRLRSIGRIKIICYGTSLTQVSGYPELLQKKLGRRYAVLNWGYGGKNSNFLLSNVDTVKRLKPDIVIYESAINDASILTTWDKPVTLNEAFNNIHKIIQKLLPAKIIMLTMNPPIDLYCYGRNPFRDRPNFNDYNEMFKRIAEANKLTLVDTCKVWKTHIKSKNSLGTLCGKPFYDYLIEEFIPDGLHPTIKSAASITAPMIYSHFQKINLCSGKDRRPDYINIDIKGADINIDLEKKLLPFDDNSISEVLFMSAINYFTKERALKILIDIRRVLKPAGKLRIGVQDLKIICMKYLDSDPGYDCDRINRWFNSPSTDGYKANGKRNKYVYDFRELADLLIDAGFSVVRESEFNPELDNRAEQMFFIEAIKTGRDKSYDDPYYKDKDILMRAK